MNPFDLPPTTPAVSFDPPETPGDGGPRRSRVILAVLAAAGLVGGGIVVTGQLVAADDAASSSTTTVPVAPEVDDSEPVENEPVEPAEPVEPTEPTPRRSGEIVIDDGSGAPFEFDLGAIDDGVLAELSECIGLSMLGDGPLFDGEFHDRVEEFLDEVPWDEMADEMGHAMLDDGVRIFGSGGSTVTVVGPDGVEVIDLGDGDATVTIEQRDGEITVDTDGTADAVELPDLGSFDLGELDGGILHGSIDEMLAPLDLDRIEGCLDDLGD